MNYVAGLPFSVVSIGLLRGISPILGVVNDFWRGELFYGAKGLGAWLNEKPLKPVSYADSRQTVAAFGKRAFTDPRMMKFSKDNFLQARNLGSAALQHVYVAVGRLGFCHYGANIWDLAGAMGVLEALNCQTQVKLHSGFHVELTSHGRQRGEQVPLPPE